MIQYFIESGIIWTGLYLFYFFLLKKETFFSFNRYFLLLSLMAGLVIPLIQINIPVSDQAVYISSVLETISIGNGKMTETILPVTSGAGFLAAERILFLLYSMISLLFFSKLIHGLFGIYSIYKQGDKKEYVGHTEISLVSSRSAFSFFKLIFIPKHLYSNPDIDLIRKHELKHALDLHSLDIIFMEILESIFWFNPILSLYKNAIVEVHEFIADRSSLQLTERKHYGNLLISLKKEPIQLALTNRFKNSIIKNRIIMMYQTNSNRTSNLKYLLAIPLVFVFFLLFSCQQENNKETEVQNANEKLIQETIVNTSTTSTDEVFKVVEKMPSFPGCDLTLAKEELEKCSNSKLMNYIFTNLKYPEAAKKEAVQGKVLASFVIDKSGFLTNIKIIQDIGSGCGDEVVRVLETMNQMDEKWNPGKQRGEAVKVEFTLPVVFRLE